MCLMSCLLGENRDIFFPKLSEKLHLITFSEIAVRYLAALGYEAFACASEDEARARTTELIAAKRWPCYFFKSDTTGEKDFEEFYTGAEVLQMERFESIGVVRNDPVYDAGKLDQFTEAVVALKARGRWERQELVDLFHVMLPDFGHKETGKYLDGRM